VLWAELDHSPFAAVAGGENTCNEYWKIGKLRWRSIDEPPEQP